ncbi:DUF928 domain-containing protein [Acaryochloris sp. IP29b_bin.137]|uniref:DUF928 domain-containing protein n=1 Tax=Acaryochloris sp. IP29b_bin.137 TaxID=2969217 RepID=UPI00261D98BD|nr:DUF928 domain-containing protein [Acaryochloris sp. IP29b_bin.137]
MQRPYRYILDFAQYFTTGVGLLSLGSLLSLTMASTVWGGYTPPPNPSAPSDRGYTAGTRNGCAGNEQAALTVIAPHSHIGRTTSTRPTLTWFVPDQTTYPLELAVVGSSEKHTTPMIKESISGFGHWTIPEKQSLAKNHKYRWQVVLVCNQNRPSTSLVVEAEIEVVEMPPDLASALATVSEPVMRSQLYAKAGFWYDAFAEVITLKDVAARDAALALLKDLSTQELAHPSQPSIQQGQRLQQILQTQSSKATANSQSK